MVEPLNAEARAAALSWIAADDAESADEICSVKFDGCAGRARLWDGRVVFFHVDEDLSGKGARFVVFTALSGRDDAWVARKQNELLTLWDEREVEHV